MPSWKVIGTFDQIYFDDISKPIIILAPQRFLNCAANQAMDIMPRRIDMSRVFHDMEGNPDPNRTP